jgi:hypothetical protein
MQRQGSIRWPLGITLAALTFSQSIQAKESASINAANTASGAVTTNTTSESDYGYRFSDDPMQAGVFTPADARLVVAGRVIRTQLIRPRTMFVVEMLRSVESL